MQYYGSNAKGGYLASPKLSAKMRKSAIPLLRFRQFVRVEPGFGKHKGEKLLFDRMISNYSYRGPISELDRMPEGEVQFGQGEIIADEYGLAMPWTGKLENLSEFSVNDQVQKALRDDMVRQLDTACGNVFTSATIKYVPTGTSGSPTGTFETTLSTTATRDVSVFDVKEIIDALSGTYWAEKYDGQNYICIANRKFLRKIMDDADWQDAKKYGDPEALFSGETGRLYGCRFVEENNVLSSTLGSTSYAAEAVFFGADPVVEGVVVPEEFRQKVSVDYGRDHGLAWYFLGGWSLTWEDSSPGRVKVIHLTSA